MKKSEARKKHYQEILDTLPLPWKYLQKSPVKQSADGYESDSSVHDMPSSAVNKITTRRVRVRRAGARHSSDSVPTAHVQPTTTSRNVPLRATQRFAWDEPKRAAGPQIFHGTVDRTEDVQNKVNPAENTNNRRWGSLNSLQDNFQDIPVDTDPTMIDHEFHDPAVFVSKKDKEYRLSNPDLAGVGYVPQSHTHEPYHRPSSVPPDMPYNVVNPGVYSSRDRNISPRDTATNAYLYPYSKVAYNTNGVYSSSQQSAMYPPEHDGLTGVNMRVSAASEHSVGDVTQWQQYHQEQLRKQRLEPTYGTSHRADPLDAVMKATDNIVKEKDAIIDKLKGRIMELEQQCKNLDVALQSAVMKNKASFHIKEKKSNEYMNPGLTSELEKKLGEREYEIQKLTDNFRSELHKKNEQIQGMQEKYETKDGEMLEWKLKYSEVNASYVTAQKELSDMKRYLADIPTADETSKKNHELKSLKDDKARYKSKLHELENKLSEASRLIKSKEALVESMERNEKDMENKLQATLVDNERLIEKIKIIKSREGAITGADIDDLKHQIDRLGQELRNAKKLIDGKHKKIQQMEAKNASSTKQLQERLAQEEAAVLGLRQDISSKDMQLKKLRAAHKMLGNEKQDIMEKLMVCEEKLKEFERQNTGKIAKLQRRLLMEMGTCFSELQSLVEVCLQGSEGQDPNISALISVKSHSLGDGLDQAWMSQDESSLEHRVSKVKGLRLEIDKIRDKVATKYAEDMGDNLNCTQQ